MTTRGFSVTLEMAKEEGAILCPFTSKTILCFEKKCHCPIRALFDRVENDRIARGVKDGWRCVNSGAE